MVRQQRMVVETTANRKNLVSDTVEGGVLDSLFESDCMRGHEIGKAA
jgi:hypothetical protein